MPTTLPHLFTVLGQHPSLLRALSFDQLCLFVRLGRRLRPRLRWHCSAGARGPPPMLPPKLRDFLSDALAADPFIISDCWSALQHVVWDDFVDAAGACSPCEDLSSGDFDVFARRGGAHEIGPHDLFPPYRACTDPCCAGRELTKLEVVDVAVFTRDNGPVRAWSHSASCPNCRTRYYPDYVVQKNDVGEVLRTYYRGIPRMIHVTTHVYVERAVCERFEMSMVCAWVSASNNAKIYMAEHERTTAPFAFGRGVSPILRCEIVWDAFFLHALLREHDEQHRALVLLQNAEQLERIEVELRKRNKVMVGPGQENWNHVCNLCSEVVERADGTQYLVRAVVTDGIAIGRPCCGVHDCKNRLPSTKSRFCGEHADMDGLCVVRGCGSRADAGRRTCAIETHRALEKDGVEWRTAMFQLTRRLERLKAPLPEDALDVSNASAMNAGLADDLDAVDAVDVAPAEGVDEAVNCPLKPSGGNVQPKARFGRRRTHNEQLVVACCGETLARGNFNGSEGQNGVRIFLRSCFPTPKSCPSYAFYDSACNFLQHVHHVKDDHFHHMAMPVDVFHMKTKHKDTDGFCARNCNPANFPDLITADNKWRFNSSAAEMTNAWFGGFQSIVREMREDRYEFFLDEMIKLRNRLLLKDLRTRGAQPWNIPRHVLLS